MERCWLDRNDILLTTEHDLPWPLSAMQSKRLETTGGLWPERRESLWSLWLIKRVLPINPLHESRFTTLSFLARELLSTVHYDLIQHSPLNCSTAPTYRPQRRKSFRKTAVRVHRKLSFTNISSSKHSASNICVPNETEVLPLFLEGKSKWQ